MFGSVNWFRMAFELDDFYFLFFWSAATNAFLFWEFLRYFNADRYPEHVTQSHWVVKFIRLLPRAGKWEEVSLGLRQQVSGLRGYAPFTYRGLIEFLITAEEVLDTLGSGQRTRQEDADQLIYDVLIEPTEHMDLPVTTTSRSAFEVRQMRALVHENPEGEICIRMTRLWRRWVETKGVVYPRGLRGTWMRIRELVMIMPRIEEANTDYIAMLLAPPPPSPPGSKPPPSAVRTTISSEGSNSVTGPLCPDHEENQG